MPRRDHRRRVVRAAIAAMTLACLALAPACTQTRLARSLTSPDRAQTLDHRSAFLKVHTRDGTGVRKPG